MASGAMNITGMITPVQRAVNGITPEFYFHKTIDNSRLIRVVDPQRRREIRMFSATMGCLFLLMMFYAWQHFRALEYGYRIEAQRSEEERLAELNRTLRFEEASLRDPARIDALARQMGLESPHPGQVGRLDADAPGLPVVARLTSVAVVPAQ